MEPTNAKAYVFLGNVLLDQGKLDAAVAAWDKAIELQPDDAEICNTLAWILATEPDPKNRNPNRAVELANKATELAPSDGYIWNTLGVARYRASKWQDSMDAIEKGIQLRGRGNSSDWFFMAMADWQLGHKEEAQDWYRKAVDWMDKNAPTDDQLIRFRAEAAELLGIVEPQSKVDPEPQKNESPTTTDDGERRTDG
jgi:superkiller protein 3